MAETKTLGQIACDTFFQKDGAPDDPYFSWDALKNDPDARQCWEIAAQAVRLKTIEECVDLANEFIKQSREYAHRDERRGLLEQAEKFHSQADGVEIFAEQLSALKDKSNDQG
jgi:hypothetical protein